ncbi:FAD dependent oxidoreductase [Solidesulfovibrio fructosivorans JJ]]|uniref:L-aspartate oxidase n=1 Tax=Solidesulfovibrio fructosivorans JJ] TaxID=596151 RepID=E1JRZ8_SOLFR|nr:FAD-binding protein [Solidesulfovibrio fructosivorans]EFL52767.1 FAD dependent oxidoreductase [Solidesulfovibrio fructosivorans JJ]]
MDFDINTLPPCDVLILGAGLAGLCAARAALAAVPGAAVTVVAPWPGPTGSSFANRNGRLGLHVPADDAAREAFCREATALGRPGFVRPDLVAALADEAAARCRELEELGLSPRRDADGHPAGQPSCFSPHSRRAVILEDLPAAFDALHRRVTSLGGRFSPGLTALSLLRDPDGGRVRGALVEDYAGRRFVAPARETIAAMGGTAGLWLYNQAGRGGSGWGHGMLAEAGADMANTAFMQWMWMDSATRRFWPVWRLATGEAVLRDDAGRSVALPGDVRTAAAGREGHCPLGHGLADAALDRFVLDHADGLGIAAITEGEATFQAVLAAHAANGGAVIDATGATDVPGLFAAGECATGMHGANRLGGAMATACLVFGARAGRAAALRAKDAAVEAGDIRGLAASDARACRRDMRQRGEARRQVADALQRLGLPRRDADPEPLLARLESLEAAAVDAGAASLVAAALCFARGKACAPPVDSPAQAVTDAPCVSS